MVLINVTSTRYSSRRFNRFSAWLGLLILTALVPGCSWFRVKSVRPVPNAALPLPAKTASKEELVGLINELAKSTKTLSLTVLFELTTASAQHNQIENYRETKGFILIRTPDNIRIIGQAFNINVFDMVSDGKETSVFVPSKNKYFHFLNSQKLDEKKIPVGSLRPQHVLDALAIEAVPPDSPDQVVVMEQDQEGRHSYYILDILKMNSQHDLSLERKIWIDRFDLKVVRQKFFEREGKLASEVTYSDFEEFAGASYPATIIFRRPIEDYSLHIKVSKVKMNEVLTDDKFVINRPQDSEFVDLSEAQKTPTPSQPVF